MMKSVLKTMNHRSNHLDRDCDNDVVIKGRL